MMFDKVIIRYLFILLLSIHLSVSQSTTVLDSTEPTEITTLDSAASSVTNTEYTSTDEPLTNTEAIIGITSDANATDSSLSTVNNIEFSTSSSYEENTFDTDTASLTNSSDETTSIILNTDPSTAPFNDSLQSTDDAALTPETETAGQNTFISVETTTLNEEVETGSVITSTDGNEVNSSTGDYSSVTTFETLLSTIAISSSSDAPISATEFTETTDLISPSSDITVNPSDATLTSIFDSTDSAISETTNDFTILSTENPSPITMESSSDQSLASSDTTEIKSTSSNTEFFESTSADTDTATSATPVSASYFSAGTDISEHETSTFPPSMESIPPNTEEPIESSVSSSITPDISSGTEIPTVSGETLSPTTADTGSVPSEFTSIFSVTEPTILSTQVSSDITFETASTIAFTGSSESSATQESLSPAESASTIAFTGSSESSATQESLSPAESASTLAFTGSSESSATQENPSSPESASTAPSFSEISSGSTVTAASISTQSAEPSTAIVTNSPASVSDSSNSFTSISTTIIGNTGTSSPPLTSTAISGSVTTSFQTSVTSPVSSSTSEESVNGSTTENISTSATSNTTTRTTVATTTTNPNIFIPVQPVAVGFTVTQIIDSDGLDALGGEQALFEKIAALLAPELIYLGNGYLKINNLMNKLQTSLRNYIVFYSVTYRGFGDPSPERIKEFISKQTKDLQLQNTAINMTISASCSVRQQGACYYCGTESPCADIPESECRYLSDANTLNYVCKCDRPRHFFRTNYEYDSRCSRMSFLWWPQMLAICLLVFLIFILLAALLIFYRRRQHIISKKLKREPEVLSNAPQRTSEFEYIELKDPNQLSNEKLSTFPNIRSPPPYQVDESSDYVYRRRAPQNYTYPARVYPYVQRGVPPNYYSERNNHSEILDDLFHPNRGGDQHMNVPRGIDNDDEIFV